MRALAGHYAWLVCPSLLARLNRDMAAVGIAPVPVPRLQRNTCLVDAKSPVRLRGGDRVVLEEFAFSCAGAFPGASGLARFAADLDARRVVCLHDEDFTYFTRQCLPMVTRNALDYERKTVRPGALFQMEMLPPDTVFYSCFWLGDARGKEEQQAAAWLLSQLEEALLTGDEGTGVVRLGAEVTVGLGTCGLHLVRGGEAA